MTESDVTYIQAASSEAGAIPRDTNVATHNRASDGAEVQDVYIDGVRAAGMRDFWMEVVKGNIPGYSVIHKFGASAIVGTTLSPIALGNTYQTPTTAQALEVVSNDANDTAAGSGAREITFIGLGNSWTEISQTVATTGTTPVALPTNLTRLYRWYVSASGTYATAAAASHVGTLTIRAAGGGATWSTITVSPFPMGQSQIGVYTIPAGKKGYIVGGHIYVSSAKAVDVLIFQRPSADDVSAPYSAMRLVSQWAGVTGYIPIDPKIPRGSFVGPCDIGFMGKVAAGTGTVTVELVMVLEDV